MYRAFWCSHGCGVVRSLRHVCAVGLAISRAKMQRKEKCEQHLHCTHPYESPTSPRKKPENDTFFAEIPLLLNSKVAMKISFLVLLLALPAVVAVHSEEYHPVELNDEAALLQTGVGTVTHDPST